MPIDRWWMTFGVLSLMTAGIVVLAVEVSYLLKRITKRKKRVL